MEHLLSLGSDELVMMVVPTVVYWVYSGMYEVLGYCSYSMDKYRLHSRSDEEAKNLASKRDVVKAVLRQQLIQAAITLLAAKITSNVDVGNNNAAAAAAEDKSMLAAAGQFLVAMMVFDTWQYFVHRYMHHNKHLYRRFHSWHHRIAAPYAFAAQYSHPVDGFVIETVAGALAYFVSGMSAGTATVFFSFATVKGIDDHCGLMLPWNPFHVFFQNNTAYHDTHHQLAGSKCNFAQPFFVTWDKLLGTYVPYEVVKRDNGTGFEARIMQRNATKRRD